MECNDDFFIVIRYLQQVSEFALSRCCIVYVNGHLNISTFTVTLCHKINFTTFRHNSHLNVKTIAQ